MTGEAAQINKKYHLLWSGGELSPVEWQNIPPCTEQVIGHYPEQRRLQDMG